MNASYDDKGNNDEGAPETSYDGANIDYYSNDEGNNDEVAPEPPTNDINIDSDGEKKYDYVTPGTHMNGGNIETIDNDEEK